jgi:peroxiredoxin
LPVGAPAPDFQLASLAGGLKKLADWRGRRVLLIFFNPRCGFCSRMAPELAALPVEPAGGRPLPLVVTTGSVDENRQLVEEHALRCPVLLQEGGEVASDYHAAGTPMGYLLDEQGRIASELAVGAEALLALAGSRSLAADNQIGPASAAPGRNGHRKPSGNRSLSESRLNRSGLPAGSPAPAFRLPRLDGGELSLEEYRGRRVLLVFSDPHCGPCDALLPELERRHRQSRGLAVLLIGRGKVEENRQKVREHRLTFPVALQKQWEVSRRYAMFATPMAYLIDEQGRIARDVAAGVEPILALARDAAPAANGKQETGREEVVPLRR